MVKLLKNNVKCQGHLKVKVINNVCWLMKKLLEEIETNANCLTPLIGNYNRDATWQRH